MSEADDLDQRLAALKVKYASRLKERVGEVAAMWSDIKTGRRDDLHDLTVVVHKLSGSAGMYGQEALGEAAKALEHVLEAHEKDSRIEPEMAAEIDSLIDRLALEIS